MATKYTRETEVWEEREARRTPWMRQGPVARPLSRRQRLFIMLAGFAAVILLAQIALRLNDVAPYAFQSVHRGTGIVVDLTPPVASAASMPDARPILIEIPVGDVRSMQGIAHVPEEYWPGLNVGDKLAVLFQVHKLGTELRILEVGLVALSDDMR